MIGFESMYVQVQDITKNTDSTQLVAFKKWINLGYHKALGKVGRWFLEETDDTTLDTKASTQFYDLPVHYLRMKSVSVTISSQVYVLEKVTSQDYWDELNALQTSESDIPTHYFVRANAGRFQVGLFPTPSTAGYDITLVFERREKDLSADDYTTGTVTVTNGDETITGSGTTWTAFMANRMFKTNNDGNWYRIASFTSATSMELAIKWEGATASGASYTITEAPLLPEDFHDLPVYFALFMWFSQQKDPEQTALYKNLYDQGIKDLQSVWGARATGNVIRSRTRRRYIDPHRPLTITM